ncbi:hypothetical protein [Rhizobium sp. BK377]|uniref:hypothetical protein n=1 Tax=Rhizobium sp. BK377 TaxID=2587058 RepID=UPI001614BA6E|nr:hypothetical protein [Rhizobium sp. BK377]MBB3461973.1 hypothetical protein [Rhizobium sp. BK377]
MNTTPNFNLPKPIDTADVDEEFYRLQLAWDMLDLILFSMVQQIAGKSNLGHGHAIGDIVGLVAALANKMDATRTFSLDDLTDVDGAAEAALNYLLVKGSDGKWMPSSASAALGAHQHAQGDIVGLTDDLTSLSQAIDETAAALADKQDRVASTDQDMNGRDVLNVRKVNGGQLSSFRNKLINGDFSVFQRVAVPTTGVVVAAGASAYVADRWLVTNTTNQPVTVSRQLHILGQAAVPGRPKFKMRLAFATAPTTGTIRVAQRVEGVETLDGAASARAHLTGPAGAEVLACEVVQNFGTGGAPSASVVTAASSLDIATIYNAATQIRKAQFAIPSIAGKTIGSNGNDFVELGWVLTPRQVGNYELSQLSFVEGDASKEADPFSPRHKGQEFALCQRYYQTRDHIVDAAGTNNYSPYQPVALPVQMRVAPTGSHSTISTAGSFSGPTISYTAERFGAYISNTSATSNTWVGNIKMDAEL